MRLKKQQLAIITTTGLLFAVFQNCAKSNFGTSQASLNALNADYGGQAICDPLGDGANTGSGRQGLIGTLYYVPSALNPTPTLISDGNAFVKYAVKADATVFMAQMNVPTRDWTTGFKSGDGSFLKDPSSGQPLTEYFGLNMQSNVVLSANDQEGYYQFATISDDGALLTSGSQVLAGKVEGIHSTKTQCGQTLVYMKKGAPLPINYFYFQAPRTEIASVIAWRRVAGNAIPDQVDCDQFFAFTNDNGAGWASMQQVGWNIIPAANFQLPSDAPTNQCH